MTLFLPGLGSSAQLVVQDELKWNQTVVEALKIWRGTKDIFSNSPGASENSPAPYANRIWEAGSQRRWKLPKQWGLEGKLMRVRNPRMAFLIP